jgi:tetratricopeptide (TPR) repeat protein/tRNA A-37 threonylcarbamoyl transferase component Bud32
MLVLAAGEGRKLSNAERDALHSHVVGCASCRAVAGPITGSEPTVADVGRGATLAFGSDEKPAPRVAITRLATSELIRGESIGRFLVLDLLGAGGMGVVHSAYDPYLDRKVAIKLLRSAAASEDGTTRLMREAQAMARIKHPNVITVHEVGRFRSQVYVAMEFADAGTLRGWFDGNRRTQREIVDVFVQAGRGLAAAHAAGLVHRDFKPDNVLMSKDGGVLVTDFGLVSTLASDQLAAEPAVRTTPLSQDLTHTGAIMGTPAYMAPEQFDGKPTAKSDQFAFCVALYEALYGQRPFAGTNYMELQANVAVGAVAPPKRGDVPSWLRKLVLRGLAVDPQARFPAMTELLDALSRAPQRRRRRVIAVAAALGVVGAGAVAVTRSGSAAETCAAGAAQATEVWNPTRENAMRTAFGASKRPHAQASLRKAGELIGNWTTSWQDGFVGACRDTHEHAQQTETALDLRLACLTRRLDDVRATIDALIAGGDDAVDHAIEIATDLPSIAPCADVAGLLGVPPPEASATGAVAEIRKRVDDARGMHKLGRYAQALAIAKPAVDAARAAGYAPATAEALVEVGVLQHELADRAAASTLDEAMRVAAAAGDEKTVVAAAAWLVFTLASNGAQFEAAGAIASYAGAVAQHAHAGESAIRLELSTGIANDRRGRPADARKQLEHALERAEHELGADHALTLGIVEALGNNAQSQGRFGDARKLFERVVASRERVFGKDHPAYAHALERLAEESIGEDKLDDAQQLYERALAIRRAALGGEHPLVAGTLDGLGVLYAHRNDDPTAQHYFEQALAIWEKSSGPDSVEVTPALMNLALIYDHKHDFANARKLFERALAILERVHGPDNPNLLNVLNNLGNLSRHEERYDDALALFRRKLRIVERVYGPEHPAAADTLANMAIVLRTQKKLDEAEELTTRALHATEKAYGAEHTRTAMNWSNLGGVQSDRHHYTEALESFHRAQAIFEKRLGPDHPNVAIVLDAEAYALVELKRFAEAVPVLEHALAIRVAKKASPDDLGDTRFSLARALAADPKQRARAHGEATKALGELTVAKDTDGVAKIKAWLKTH